MQNIVVMSNTDKKRMLGSEHWLARPSPARDYVSTLNQFLSVEGKRLLDIGCGHGVEVNEFNKLSILAEGVDLESDFISFAQKNYSNLSFTLGDAENLPYAENTFDITFCINTLFFTNPEKSIPEMCRVTKPNGVCVISFDTQIRNLETDTVIHQTKFSNLLTLIEFSSCSLLYVRYKERVDLHPFKHKHEYYEVFFKKFG